MPDPLMDALPLDPNDPRIKAMGLGIRAPQLLGPLADLAKPQPPPEANKSIFAVNPVAPDTTQQGPTPQAQPKPLSQQYAELQVPRRDDPQYKVPGWKKALGLTAGFALGSPDLVRSSISGPYDRAMQDYKNKGLAIEQQSKIGDTESQMREHERKANEPYRPESIGNEEAQAVEEQVAKGTPRVDAIGQVKSAGQKVPEAEQPLGEKTTNLNKALESRYQVLNPGKPLPPELSLDSKATQKDFDRVDKIMQQTESAKGTAVQQETTNEIRRQTASLAQQSFALRQDEATARRADKAEAQRQFHPAIAQQVVQGMTTQESTRRLLQILEPYKNDNDPFGSFLKTMEYKLGKAQTDEIGKELASINLTSLQQAGSVLKGMGGVRSAVVLDKVLQHTPDSTKDSVKLMYDKLINIDRATAIFLDDADKYGRKSGVELPPDSTKPYSSQGSGVQPPAGASDEVYAKDGKTLIGHIVNGKYVPLKK